MIFSHKPVNLFLTQCGFSWYNLHMKTKYTPQQISRFNRFCDRHGLAFATITEYNSAIAQFFLKD